MIKERIESAMIARNVSMKDLAKELGTDISELKEALYSGSLQYDDMVKISNVLDVSVKYFTGAINDFKPKTYNNPARFTKSTSKRIGRVPSTDLVNVDKERIKYAIKTNNASVACIFSLIDSSVVNLYSKPQKMSIHSMKRLSYYLCIGLDYMQGKGSDHDLANGEIIGSIDDSYLPLVLSHTKFKDIVRKHGFEVVVNSVKLPKFFVRKMMDEDTRISKYLSNIICDKFKLVESDIIVKTKYRVSKPMVEEVPKKKWEAPVIEPVEVGSFNHIKYTRGLRRNAEYRDKVLNSPLANTPTIYGVTKTSKVEVTPEPVVEKKEEVIIPTETTVDTTVTKPNTEPVYSKVVSDVLELAITEHELFELFQEVAKLDTDKKETAINVLKALV